MVDMLLDTNILVDLLRNYPLVVTWKNAQVNVIMGISSVVYMEVLEGMPNKVIQARTLKFLKQFDVVYLTEDDQKWAMVQLVKFKLSHNVGMMDCLIAAPVSRLNLPFCTRNAKHFLPIIPTLVNVPY